MGSIHGNTKRNWWSSDETKINLSQIDRKRKEWRRKEELMIRPHLSNMVLVLLWLRQVWLLIELAERYLLMFTADGRRRMNAEVYRNSLCDQIQPNASLSG